MVRPTRNASLRIRSASRLGDLGGRPRRASVSASRPRAPTGVFSSWLMLATKSRRTASRRRRSVTSSMTTTAPTVRRSSSSGVAAITSDPPGRAEQVEGARMPSRPSSASASSSSMAASTRASPWRAAAKASATRVAEHDLAGVVGDDARPGGWRRAARTRRASRRRRLGPRSAAPVDGPLERGAGSARRRGVVAGRRARSRRSAAAGRGGRASARRDRHQRHRVTRHDERSHGGDARSPPATASRSMLDHLPPRVRPPGRVGALPAAAGGPRRCARAASR